MPALAAYQFRTTAERDAYRALVEGGETGLKTAQPVWGIDMFNRWCDNGLARLIHRTQVVPHPHDPGRTQKTYTEHWQGFRKNLNLPVRPKG